MNKLLLSGIAALALSAGPASATLLYAVDGSNNLVSFDSATPGATLSSVAIAGAGSGPLLGIDFRPNTNILYGLTSDFRLLTINQITGASALVSNLAVGAVTLSGSAFAFDFNPTNNNLRIVSENNTNYVYNFMTNALTSSPAVAFGAGDPNVGANPSIIAAGYTNNDMNATTGTTLFVLDSDLNILATQVAATGVLGTRGALGVDIGANASFDITGTSNQAFVRDGNTLYSLNTTTGALTSLGNTAGTFFGLAAPVPEPSTWAMMIAGFGLVGAGMRRRAANGSLATA